MKRILSILITIAALSAAASCQKEEVMDTVASSLVGEWHLTETETDGIVIDHLTDVYLTINADCTFLIYQKSGDQTRYTVFTGTCKSVNNVFSGIYSDGSSFGCDYEFFVEGDTLTLSTADGIEVQTWTKESLDQEDKDNADMKVKSSAIDVIPFL